MVKKRLAIIGSGIIAEAHVAAALESERLTVTAVADPLAERREKLAKLAGASAFSSLDDLLSNDKARAEVDAAVICTPPSIRIDLVEAALSQKLPVLIEKPLAHTVSDAQALANIAQCYADTPTAVAYCHRFTPAIREIKRRLLAGDLGSPVRFENVFACWHPTMQQSWMSDPKRSGGGSLLDTGSHGVDLFHYLIGSSQTDAAVLSHQWPGRGDTNATLLIHHDNADASSAPVAGFLASGWAEAARFIVTVVGTDGSMHYDFEKPEELVWSRSQDEAQTLTIETHETRFRHQLEAFADLIDNPSATSDLATFEDGLAVSITLQDALEQVVGV